MATFNVFVVGPVDDSPMGLPELADAMSQRYGLPAAELVTRLKRGRFRVKSNLDATAAERYRRDLESIGARVVVEDSAMSPTATPVAGTPIVRPSGPSLPPVNQEQADPRTRTIMGPLQPREPARPSTPPAGVPANRPSTPPSGLSAAGPQHARPSTPAPTRPTPIPRPSTPIPADMVSGLSAAFGEAGPQADLGALGGNMLSLASLDGEEAPAASNQFESPPPPLPEEEKPVVKIAARPKSAEPPRARPAAPSKAMDLFAPPDAGDQDLSVDLATEEVDDRARKQASAPPPVAPAASGPIASQSQPMPTPTPDGATSAMPKPFSREKFLIGVVIALVVGFIPAHFTASMREKSAFAEIDNQVAAAQESADSFETYQALDSARAKYLDDKRSKRSMIGLTSMLMWAVISSGVGFAFFRLRK